MSEAHRGLAVPWSFPAFLTIGEAAAVLRIGRTVAYALAKLYEASDGTEGLPVVRIGRQLRVPRAHLEALAGAPLTRASDSAA